MIVEPASRAGEAFSLGEELSVGRGAGCAVVLADDTFVSTVHARIFMRGSDPYVEDLGSTNGTLLNGETVVEPIRLRPGRPRAVRSDGDGAREVTTAHRSRTTARRDDRMRIVSGASTDTGQVRDGNEDSYLVDRRLELFAVADGMGGHRAGEIASATALDGLRLAVDEGTPVADAVGRANTAVWDKAAGDTDLAGMGTTLTAAIFDAGTLTIAHVGDSRAYLLRDDRLERLTTDHSLVEELIRDGKLTEEQAAVHPQRSIITRALGVDSSVEVDVYSLVLQGGDRVIICSDGLTSMVRAAGIAEILRARARPHRGRQRAGRRGQRGRRRGQHHRRRARRRGRGQGPAAELGGRGDPAAHRPGRVAPRPIEVVEATTVGVVTTTTSIDARRAGAPEPPRPRPPARRATPPGSASRAAPGTRAGAACCACSRSCCRSS